VDEIFNGLVRNYDGLGFHAVVTGLENTNTCR
jgi:hypothetical protein